MVISTGRQPIPPDYQLPLTQRMNMSILTACADHHYPLRYKIDLTEFSCVPTSCHRLFGSFVYEDNPERSDEPCLLNPDCKSWKKYVTSSSGAYGNQKFLFYQRKTLGRYPPWCNFPGISCPFRINFFATDTRRHAITDALARQHKPPAFLYRPPAAFESYTGTEPYFTPGSALDPSRPPTRQRQSPRHLKHYSSTTLSRGNGVITEVLRPMSLKIF